MTIVEQALAPSNGDVRATTIKPAGYARSQKISSEHLEHLAIVYVRQSSPYQVLENRESTARQYALADYAQDLGWRAERVLVIDEDQGRSGATAEHRSGFQRLLAEVTMDHVGIVLGLEMSRLARSSKDWHHLLELCALFGTLLGDQDGIYNPGDPNDRMLLGLKGTMSEVELHTMRNRLDRGRLNKAQRGELFFSVPMGYVLLPTGEAALDPDEQARAAIHLVFDKFEELQIAAAVFGWLIAHDIRMPAHLRTGPRKGQIEWRRPALATIYQILHNPIYAGAYAYGRRPMHRKPIGGKRRSGKWLPIEKWEVLLRDQLPAYITWDRYLKNQERLKQNHTRPDTTGTPRNGCALLSGLVICGECGWRMQVGYGSPGVPHYRCLRHTVQRSEQRCFGLSAKSVDEQVTQQVLRALEPAAIEVSIKAQADARCEHQRLDRHWSQRLKRMRYDVELAERRYQAVDPANRLVAATLERQWEDAMRQERELQEEYDRCRRQSCCELSTEQELQIAVMASDLPTLWRSPRTTNADRQAIVRCVVERVVVHVSQHSERTEAVIRWVGGFESRLGFSRPVRRYDQLADRSQLMKRLVELRSAVCTAEQTADALNAEGFLPINPKESFNREIVRALLLKLNLRGEQNDRSLLTADEWWIRDLAAKLGMAWQTLREWAVRGWVHGRQTNVQKLWVMWADEEEVDRLIRLKNSRSRGFLGYPAELTTPKSPT